MDNRKSKIENRKSLDRVARAVLEMWSDAGKVSRMKVCGHSMYPMLRDGDTLVVRHGREIARGDVVVCLRGDETVVHRVIRIARNRVLTKGDNVPGFDPPGEVSEVVGRAIRVEGSRELALDTSRCRMVGARMARYHSLCYGIWDAICGATMPFFGQRRAQRLRDRLAIYMLKGSRVLGRMLR